MKTRDLFAIGIPAGPCADRAKQILQDAYAAKRTMKTVQDDLKRLAAVARSGPTSITVSRL